MKSWLNSKDSRVCKGLFVLTLFALAYQFAHSYYQEQRCLRDDAKGIVRSEYLCAQMEALK